MILLINVLLSLLWPASLVRSGLHIRETTTRPHLWQHFRTAFSTTASILL